MYFSCPQGLGGKSFARPREETEQNYEQSYDDPTVNKNTDWSLGLTDVRAQLTKTLTGVWV